LNCAKGVVSLLYGLTASALGAADLARLAAAQRAGSVLSAGTKMKEKQNGREQNLHTALRKLLTYL
jgi:hypothetical protein